MKILWVWLFRFTCQVIKTDTRRLSPVLGTVWGLQTSVGSCGEVIWSRLPVLSHRPRTRIPFLGVRPRKPAAEGDIGDIPGSIIENSK